ncbi:MAG: alpha/beta hydrolase family protein, partial [Gammaproteobacteria bacterium]|nr:alpha/beta hydrolase family protein [Gammaproteobacteria bacterium]
DAAPASDAPPLLAQPAAPEPPEPALLARLEAKTLPADFIKLGGDTKPFLARYAASAKPEARGAVLFLPAPGRFIGDDPVIAAALDLLPAGGWSVLAVQTPLLAATAPLADYAATDAEALARAKAGLEHLAKQQTPPAVVVVGQARSVALALAAAKEAGQVTAVAAIGPWQEPLGDDNLPLLDLVPDRDPADLERATARRQQASRAKRVGYKLAVLAGADVRLVGFEQDIARRIRGFAEHLPPPATTAPPPDPSAADAAAAGKL